MYDLGQCAMCIQVAWFKCAHGHFSFFLNVENDMCVHDTNTNTDLECNAHHLPTCLLVCWPGFMSASRVHANKNQTELDNHLNVNPTSFSSCS